MTLQSGQRGENSGGRQLSNHLARRRGRHPLLVRLVSRLSQHSRPSASARGTGSSTRAHPACPSPCRSASQATRLRADPPSLVPRHLTQEPHPERAHMRSRRHVSSHSDGDNHTANVTLQPAICNPAAVQDCCVGLLRTIILVTTQVPAATRYSCVQ